MIPPAITENSEVIIGFAFFFLSEAIGMSKLKDNSVLQLIIHMGMELFPYEVKRREPASRRNRPRRRRDSDGRFISEDSGRD